MNNSINTDIVKTPSQILDENDLTGKLKCYDSNLCERDRQDIEYAMVLYSNNVNDALLSTVKRLQEENEQLKHTCLMAFDNLSNGESNARYRHIEVLEALQIALKSSELNKEEQ